MGGATIRGRGLPILLFLSVGGSLAATCKYECEQTGGCTAKYSGPPRSGNTIGSCFSAFFGGGCSGTPPECEDCKDAIQCERNSSVSAGGAVVSKQAGGYPYEYVDYNQPPSVNYKCPIDPGTPNDDCTPENPCSIGEGPCTERDTCENGLRCGNKNCGNFPGNSNSDANCCYDPYRPGEGDQFVFDTRTVLGKQMELTLNWLDDAEEPTTISCCNGDGEVPVEKQCGGPGGESCKTICGDETRFHYSFDEFESAQCSADLFYRNTDIWELDDVCPAPKTWVPYVAPDYSTYQSLPSYIRGKRQEQGRAGQGIGRGAPLPECNIKDGKGCSVRGASINVRACKERKVYSPENISEFPICCLRPNFKENAKDQARKGKEMVKPRKNFQKTRDKCCDLFAGQTRGVDALKTIECPFSSSNVVEVVPDL